MQSIEQPDKREAANPQLSAVVQTANHVVPDRKLSVFYQGFFLTFLLFSSPKRQQFTFHMLIGLG